MGRQIAGRRYKYPDHDDGEAQHPSQKHGAAKQNPVNGRVRLRHVSKVSRRQEYLGHPELGDAHHLGLSPKHEHTCSIDPRFHAVRFDRLSIFVPSTRFVEI